MIFALCGLSGTGKTSICNRMVAMHGCGYVYIGKNIRRFAVEHGFGEGAMAEKTARLSLRGRYGIAGPAILSKDEILAQCSGHELTVLDAVCCPEEVAYLRSVFGCQIRVVAVHTDRSVRLSRLVRRSSRPLHSQSVHERDLLEIRELGIGETLAAAEIHLVNNHDLSDCVDHLMCCA